MARYKVPDMSCGHCKAAIEKAIAELDASAKVNVDLETKEIDVEGIADSAALLATLKEAGYPATPLG